MCLNKHFTFEGTAKRQEFWLMIVMGMVLSVVFGIISGMVGVMLTSAIAAQLVLYTSYLAISWWGLATSVRRLRDMNYNPWFVVGLFIPLVNIILIVMMGFVEAPHPEVVVPTSKPKAKAKTKASVKAVAKTKVKTTAKKAT